MTSRINAINLNVCVLYQGQLDMNINSKAWSKVDRNIEDA